jgi:hypothetical protein
MDDPIHFEFQAIQDTSLVAGTGKLVGHSVAGDASAKDPRKYAAAFRGALLHLFGEPLSSSAFADEAFEYVVQASDAEGTTWIPTAYEGPSGPAIGGNVADSTIHPVAEALLHLIESTPPRVMRRGPIDSLRPGDKAASQLRW